MKKLKGYFGMCRLKNLCFFFSPSGCTFWGKKPWSRKKKILWQLGTLVGAPVGIALIAGIAIPAMIIGIPVYVGRKVRQSTLYPDSLFKHWTVLVSIEYCEAQGFSDHCFGAPPSYTAFLWSSIFSISTYSVLRKFMHITLSIAETKSAWYKHPYLKERN